MCSLGQLLVVILPVPAAIILLLIKGVKLLMLMLKKFKINQNFPNSALTTFSIVLICLLIFKN